MHRGMKRREEGKGETGGGGGMNEEIPAVTSFSSGNEFPRGKMLGENIVRQRQISKIAAHLLAPTVFFFPFKSLSLVLIW